MALKRRVGGWHVDGGCLRCVSGCVLSWYRSVGVCAIEEVARRLMSGAGEGDRRTQSCLCTPSGTQDSKGSVSLCTPGR